MAVTTIVEDFVLAAMRSARYEPLADGTVAGSTPCCPGILSLGADVHVCSLDLYNKLEEWVRLWLVEGIALPVLEGIDLNSHRGEALTSYAASSAGSFDGTVYRDEAELEASFAERDLARSAIPPTDLRKSRASRSAAK